MKSIAAMLPPVAAVTPSLTVSVIGTGYLGATQAVCMALLGHNVMGIDVDEAKISDLSRGHLPFYEPGLDELLGQALETGRLSFTTGFAEAADADIHFICVGTPQSPDSDAADLRFVHTAVRRLASHLHNRCLIVGKSSVPVGTAARLASLVRSLSPGGLAVELAWNPEFLREGHAVEDTLRPNRIVFGVASDWAQAQLSAAYAPLIAAGTPVITTDLATAELVKSAANSFLATKISYINAMAEICEAVGGDVNLLAEALSYDERIGGQFLKPGLGFGGGCLPKDIRAFAYRARELGVGQAVSFLHQVDDINRRRRQRTVDLVSDLAYGNLADVKVTILGAAFKPDSDDIRDAPALDVARMLHRAGAQVTVFDPQAMDNARKKYPELTYAASVESAVAGAEVLALLTEWEVFKRADPVALGRLVSRRNIVDGRHALDAEAYRAAGWDYRALGIPSALNSLTLLPAPSSAPGPSISRPALAVHSHPVP
ncbi:UDP-glucose/GDP-mannose dehydrogenase family protein [Pseudarthrobacter sp. BRE9]|uniref:UDP-glucose dehydrogenase family protein n=1 Tax=Pseudarthrobacter sp. BRE9 TaxID=2962582 RepID=UPI002881E15E|nr:UDP-glucose/GDP-mannose dehydrogenase family protein [Pseudarthrobacter sp. BRE9]MDT0168525.1 UDP-glucose/GDP-mannose dehydrogenase family protein [Pseudarthrobacter sp. BRE9]